MTAPAVLHVADGAAAMISKFIAQAKREKATVRLSLVRTHCMGGRGHAYQLGFEDGPTEDAEIVHDNGITLCVDRGSMTLLRGTRIDYVETLGVQGFKIENPNAVSKCPCGHHDIFESVTDRAHVPE